MGRTTGRNTNACAELAETPENEEDERSPASRRSGARALARVVCHDIATPLSAIHLQMQVLGSKLRRGDKQSRVQLLQVVARVESLTVAGLRLVEEVLSLDRRSDPTVEMETDVNVEEAFAKAIALSRDIAVPLRDP